MLKDTITTGKLDSVAEELFMDLFCEVFGPKNSYRNNGSKIK